jgi:hypothetical protein
MLKPWFTATARWLNSRDGEDWSRDHNAGLVHGLWSGDGSPFYTIKNDVPGRGSDRWQWDDPMTGDLDWGNLPGDDALWLESVEQARQGSASLMPGRTLASALLWNAS